MAGKTDPKFGHQNQRGYDERGRKIVSESNPKIFKILGEILFIALILGPVIFTVWQKLQ